MSSPSTSARAATLERALASADEARRCWSEVSPLQRGWSLLALSRGLRVRRDRLAELLMLARPCALMEAYAEVELAACLCEDAASAAAELPAAAQSEPLGVLVGLAPNSLNHALRFTAPALAAGNACLILVRRAAPAKLAAALSSLCAAAALPPNLLQVAPLGEEELRWIQADPRVAGVQRLGCPGHQRRERAQARATPSGLAPFLQRC